MNRGLFTILWTLTLLSSCSEPEPQLAPGTPPPTVDPTTVPVQVVQWVKETLAQEPRSIEDSRISICTELAVSSVSGVGEPTLRAESTLLAEIKESYRLRDAACVAELHSALGILAAQRHDFSSAFDHYSKARYVASRIGRSQTWLAAHLNLATLHFRMGNLDEAEAMIKEGMPWLAIEGADARWRRAATLTVHGRILLQTGRAAEGIAKIQEALAIRQDLEKNRTSGQRSYLIPGLNALGRAYLDTGRLEEANSILLRVLELTEGMGLEHAHALNELAECHLLNRELEQAQARLDEVSRFVSEQNLNEVSLHLQTQFLWASLHALHGRRDKAIEQLDLVIASFESLRMHEDSKLFISFFSQRRRYIDLLIGLLAEEGRINEAFDVAEWTRARGLLDAILWPPSRVQESALPEQQMRAKALRDRLASLTRNRIDKERQILATRDALLDLEADMRRHAGALAARPVGSTSAMSLLRDGELLVVYWLGEQKGWLWIATREEGLRLVELKNSMSLLNAAREVYRLTSVEGRGWQLKREVNSLAEALLSPAGAELQTAKHVVVVADGAVGSLPFAMFPSPADSTPLIRHMSLSQVHSLSVLAALRDRPMPEREGEQIVMTIFADPKYVPAIPHLQEHAGFRAPLPAGRRSAESLSEMMQQSGMGAAKLFLGAEASRRAIQAGVLSNSRFVHIHAHVDLDPALPDLSAIRLAEYDDQGHPIDGALLLRDLDLLDLSAQVVTLAGCNTASGKSLGLEGPMAFPRGFLYAGASTVIASLWQVQEVPTALLMEEFYAGLVNHGVPPAEALRRAQLKLLDGQWPEPRHWAGFLLLGDWLAPTNQPNWRSSVYSDQSR